MSTTINIGGKGWVVISSALLMSIATSNPIATICAVMFLPLATMLLWRKNEPPILFIAFLLQWLQVTVKIFYADILNVPFEKLFEFREHIGAAYYASLLGLLVECLGIWLVLRNVPNYGLNDYKRLAEEYDLRKITIVYVIAIFLSPILVRVGFALGGLQQFIQKVADMKWSLFFMFYSITFLRKLNRQNFYLILAFEVILSFSGYFSSFREFFMFLAIGYLMLSPKLKVKQYLVLGLAALFLFNIFVVWQSVKPEYRAFLAGGEASQTVKVSNEEALKKLGELVSEMDEEAYDDGVQRLIDRTAYIDFFSACIDYVPKETPHENGRLWTNAFLHVFTPRIFFPNKPIIDDSQVAAKYTGLQLAGAAEGTSISLGYLGETYVDFGLWGMTIPLFLMGLSVGWIYKYLLNTSINPLWGFAFLLPLLFLFSLMEMALDKRIGGLIAYFLILLAVRRFAIPRLDKFFRKEERNS